MRKEVIAIEDVEPMDEVEWSIFSGRLVTYIRGYFSPFCETEYTISDSIIELTIGQILDDIWHNKSIHSLRPQLREVAKQLFYSDEMQSVWLSRGYGGTNESRND